MAQLTIYNLGRVGRVDAELEYGIKSLDGTIITSEYETLAVETQLSTVKGLDLPPSMEPDSYVFYSEVTYDGIVGTGTSMFSVIEELGLDLNFLLAIIIITIIVILIILFILVFKRRKKNGGGKGRSCYGKPKKKR